MSELTRCNWCGLKDMRARHKKEGESVHRVACKAHGGEDIFFTKKGERPINVRHAESVKEKGAKDTRCVSDNAKWSGWMMEIGSSCSC